MIEHTGIKLVRTTGKVLAEDNQYLQVYEPTVDAMGRQSIMKYYARPCYAFGDISAPSEAWLNKYKNEIFICIIHEQSNPDAPMWIGYTPIDNKLSDIPENFPNGYIKRTEKFFIRVDDERGELFIAHRESTTMGQCLKVDKNFVTLGKESANKEAAILGEKTVSLLEDLIGAILKIVLITPSGNSTGMLPTSIAELNAIKERLNTLLSISVKLD